MWTVILGVSAALLAVALGEKGKKDDLDAWKREVARDWLASVGAWQATAQRLERELAAERARVAELEAQTDPLPLVGELPGEAPPAEEDLRELICHLEIEQAQRQRRERAEQAGAAGDEDPDRTAWCEHYGRDRRVLAWLRANPPPEGWQGTPAEWAFLEMAIVVPLGDPLPEPEALVCDQCGQPDPKGDYYGGLCSRCDEGTCAECGGALGDTGDELCPSCANKPPAEDGAAGEPDAFHAHLDGCERCRTRPMDLCREGARLQREEAEMLLEHLGIGGASRGLDGLDEMHARISGLAQRQIDSLTEREREVLQQRFPSLREPAPLRGNQQEVKADE